MMAGSDMENGMAEGRSGELRDAWKAVSEQASASVSWINSTRGTVKKVEDEADAGIEKLYCVRNEANRMLRVAGTPPAIGLFGLSQAGKSYLVSSIAASGDGILHTRMGKTDLQFIRDINPVGGGKESTGLVTRFTRCGEPESDPRFCVPLRLFGECDIAKILINSCYNDFDWNGGDDITVRSSIANAMVKLDTAERSLGGSSFSFSPADGGKYAASAFPPEMVVDLREYVKNGYRNSLSFLDDKFWRRALTILPQLDIDSRADVLSELWNEEPILTDLYRELAHAVASLEYSGEVKADISVLYDVRTKQSAGMDSLMNVDALKTLGTHDQNTVTVVTEHGTEVQINRAELAALTSEIRIVLTEEPRASAAKKLDILDFPGYRGRLGISSVEKYKPSAGTNLSDNLSYELFLRGKVAFLFEQYTDDNEMNMLIVCTPSNAQQDVDISKVLTQWIDKTQGRDPQARARHKPGLFWAITKFDLRVQADLSSSQYNYGRSGLLQQTILEKFGKREWLGNWAMGKPFGNMFLVRKPRLPGGIFALDSENSETGLVPAADKVIGAMRSAFISDADVRSHIDSPALKWDSVMGLNDGGMELLTRAIEDADGESLKLVAMQNMLAESVKNAVKVMDRWHYTEDSNQKDQERRKLLAEKLFSPILKRESGSDIDSPQVDGRASLGLVLKLMNLTTEQIRTACEEEQYGAAVRTKPASAGSAETAEPEEPEKEESLDDLLDDIEENPSDYEAEPAEESKDEGSGGEAEVYSPLAEDIYQKWISHLRGLPDDPAIKVFCSGWKKPASKKGPARNIAKPLVEALTNEMITSARRSNLSQRLAKAIVANEKNAINLDEVRERNVQTISNILSDFISWLGAKDDADEEGEAKPGLFRRAETDEAGHPVIREERVPFRKNFVSDWTEQYTEAVKSNVNFDSGIVEGGVTPEANAALGKIIDAFEAAGASSGQQA